MNDLLSVKTMLLAPANHLELFVKAKDSGADGIIIDLEDTIALSEKDKVREIIIDYFKNSSPIKNFLRCLRINSIKTPAGLKDIIALIDNQISPDVIIIPKTEYPEEIIFLDMLLKQNPMYYIALIETAIGLHHADEIALSSKNIKGIFLGGRDLSADLGSTLTWDSMLYARSKLVRSAAIAGIAVFDTPYFNLDDLDDSGILEETRKVKELGFTGKFVIHSKHIKSILEVFMSSEEDVEHAQCIIDIYEKAKGCSCEFDGKLISTTMVRAAKKKLRCK